MSTELKSASKHSSSTMGSSPLRPEFLVNDTSIDCNCITVSVRDTWDGWLLSSPVTTIVSKMQLSPPHQASSSPEIDDGYLSSSTLDELTKACQATSKTLHNRLSISSYSSDPGMMFDPFNSSSSDTSFEDSLPQNPSEADLAALQTENETWDLYWTPIKESSLPQDPILSPWDRNFASSNLSSLNIPENNRNLKRRLEVRRAPRRLNHSSPPGLPLLYTYSAFPNCTLGTPSTANTSRLHSDPQSNNHPTDPQHALHNSWPTPAAPTVQSHYRTPARTRAQTIPSTLSSFTPLHPSNLSTCTTLDYQSSRTSSPCPSSSPLYMRPLPSPSLELEKRGGGLGMDIDLGNETSVWEEDDDDEGMGGLVGSLRSRLHIRSSSAQEEVGGELGVKVRQGKRMKRSLSEVVKGVFRVRRKGGTL
jgi:hypothetical protein